MSADPDRPRAVWIALLTAPVVATTYFMVVYLAAEAACSAGIEGFSTRSLRVTIASATVAAGVALAGAVAYARRGRTRRPDDLGTFTSSTALILAGLFAFFVLLVAAPVIGSALC